MANKTIITELVIDARAADAGARMWESAQAKVQAAIAKTLASQVQVDAAVRKSQPIMVEASGSLNRAAAGWDRLRSSIDPVAAAHIRAEREMIRAMDAADAAVRRGLATEVQAAQVLDQLRAKQIVDLNSVREAQQQLTAERIRGAAAANDNHPAQGVSAFATSNIAAQVQDVFVTAQMGQNPLQIALQQGAQISAVFGPMGAAGAVRTLAAAFTSLVNPVSLVTFGLVAAAAAAIQFIGGLLKESSKAEDALEEHSRWLGRILTGYEAAGRAATEASARAQMLPQGVVASDLGASLADQEQKARALQEQIDAANSSLADQIDLMRTYEGVAAQLGGSGETVWQGLVDQVELVAQLGVSAESTVPQLHSAMVAARQLYNTAEDPAVREAANSAYVLAQNLVQVKTEAYAAEVALSRLNNGAALDAVTSASDRYKTAMSGITALTPELRSPEQIAKDNLNIALGSGDAIQRIAAQKAYDEGVAARAEMARRQEALRSSRVQSPGDMFGQQLDTTRAQIEALELQNASFGATTFEATRAATAFDLVTAAQKAGLEITPDVQASIDGLAERMATAKVQAEGLQTTLAQQEPFDILRNQLAALDEQLAIGAISWETYEKAKTKATAGTAAAVAGSIAQITGTLASAFEDNKALAAANIVVSTAAAVMKTYEQGGMFATPMALAIAAAGAAQLAAVMSAKPGSASLGSSAAGAGSSTAPAMPQQARSISINLPGTQYVATESVGSLFERLNEELGVDGLRLVVTHKQA